MASSQQARLCQPQKRLFSRHILFEGGLRECSKRWTLVCEQPLLIYQVLGARLLTIFCKSLLSGYMDLASRTTYKVLRTICTSRDRRSHWSVLRVDTYTEAESRGWFAPLCVQINFEEHIVKLLQIGGKDRVVLYEGINSLFFSCGCVSHKSESCPSAWEHRRKLVEKKVMWCRLVKRG